MPKYLKDMSELFQGKSTGSDIHFNHSLGFWLQQEISFTREPASITMVNL